MKMKFSSNGLVWRPQQIDTWRKENDNLLFELYWNDKVLSADNPEGKKDEEMSSILIQTNAQLFCSTEHNSVA